MKFNKESIIKGDDYYVKYFLFCVEKPLIVTFHYAQSIPTSNFKSEEIKLFGYDFFKKEKYNIISISPYNNNHWYRSKNFHSFIMSLKPTVSLFNKKIGYGSSMGAYGISAFSNIFNFDAILLMNPISTLNSTKAPFETRFKMASKKLDWEGAYHDGASTKTKGIIIYDPFHKLDTKHVQRYGSQLKRVKLIGSGHNVPRLLLDMKLLKKIVIDFIDFKLDFTEINQLFKARKNCKFYYHNMMQLPSLTPLRSKVLTKNYNFLKSKEFQKGEKQMRDITIIGVFRTGTNYTRTLLEINYEVKAHFDKWGWKHGLIPTFTPSSNFKYSKDNILLIVKDPLSTLVSLFDYAKNTKKNIRANTESFKTFLKSPIYFFNETNNSISPEYYFSNPIQMWNSVIWNHLSFTEKSKGLVIKYENILNYPEEEAKKISIKFDLEKKNKKFFLPDKITKNMNDKERISKTDYLTNNNFQKKDYFLNKNYLKSFDKNDLEFTYNELNHTLLKKLNYKIENNTSINNNYVIYTMCDDSRISSLAILLETNSKYDNMEVKIIPFNDNIEQTKKLCNFYNAKVIDCNKKWDDLGKSLYKDKDYRPNIKAWRYFRKLNVFNEKNENFIFLDSNIVIFNSLIEVINLLDKREIVFGSRSMEKRNFTPWSKELLNISNPKIKDGFNAGFWATNSNIFNNLNIEALIKHSNIRNCLTISPEQSFLSLILALKHSNIGLIGEDIKYTLAMISGESINLDSIEEKNNSYFINNQKILTVKWTGKYFLEFKEKIPNWSIVLPFIEKIIEKTKKNKDLNNFIKLHYDKLI